MNRVDRFIRDRRIAQATRFIRPGSRVLDIGCHDGQLFRVIGPALREGDRSGSRPGGSLSAATISRCDPGGFPTTPRTNRRRSTPCARSPSSSTSVPMSARRLRPRLLVCFAPEARRSSRFPRRVSTGFLAVMMRLRILDGMEVGQHHGFETAEVEPLFTEPGLVLARHRTFQLGLNHLFVFQKAPAKERTG